jgi:micrococcal nuclease
MELYNYKATVVKVIDGDTVKLNIDLGFNMSWTTPCRLAGVNTDELKAKDIVLQESAKGAKTFMEFLLKEGAKVIIKSKSLDKYKRPIVILQTENGMNINEELVLKGYAKPYMV